MNEREQLTARAPRLTRKLKVSGFLGAVTLGEIQIRVKRTHPFTKAVCRQEHHWRMGKHTKQCVRCGLEDAR